MSSRETILGRIREALRAEAPWPGPHDRSGGPPGARPIDADHLREWLPRVGATFEEQVTLFAANAAGLKADFKVVPDAAAAAGEIRRMAAAGGWKKLATHSGPLTESIGRDAGVELLFTDQPHAVNDLERCEGGVTACDALIAQTGSVLITSRSGGGRALSVLPPHHIVLATRDQLLPDLPAAFDRLRRQYDGDYPSMISFITGPSRTGDIERILVLGAHGPKQLTILLIA